MNKPRRPQISLRKTPQQARSTELVAAILQAAIQVLLREGAARFTTARVAERAGVSVGSVYQYFPNKAAILFRLQADEWQQTTEMVRQLLQDPCKPPARRLRELVHAFIRSEFEEAQLRQALADAAPLYRAAPEALDLSRAWDGIIAAFMREALPGVSPQRRKRAGELVMTTLSTVGEHLSRSPHPAKAIQAYGEAMADMFCAYLESLRLR
ncbi:TetR family transcriptional regulator [uncultured Herbaspirillum sp.]|jgi:AcrR family transcriptional regulator|uniref:TetR family transcriptional regulator n=1 Tax=uncultured Herbaspirillum sp. TaxID=160236 RepID=UPI0025857300|nr:TetR family transcriptional regulator [uncultured Herbaspirillum sp.]